MFLNGFHLKMMIDFNTETRCEKWLEKFIVDIDGQRGPYTDCELRACVVSLAVEGQCCPCSPLYRPPFLSWRNAVTSTAQNPPQVEARSKLEVGSGKEWIAKCCELVGLCVLLQRFLNRLRTEVEILIAFCTALARHSRIIWNADCLAARCWLLPLTTSLTC